MKRPKPGRDSHGQFKEGHNLSLKHGYFPFKVTGKVPSVKGAKYLKAELKALRAELEAITPDLNVKKGLLIEQVVKSRGFMRLFEMYLNDAGILNPRLRGGTVDFQPGFRTYLSFAIQQHKMLLALGLDSRQADDVLDVQGFIKEFDKKEATKKAGEKVKT